MRTAYRKWRIARDAHGPRLDSLVLGFPLRTRGAVVTATCPLCADPPQPTCRCGIYALPDRTALTRWPYNADVLTPVQLLGRVLPGPGQGTRDEDGEVRAASVRVMGPAVIHPRLIEHAPALSRRYGVEFVPSERDLDPLSAHLARWQALLDNALSMLRAARA